MRQATPLSFSPDGKELLVASNLPGTTQLFVLPGMRQVTFDEEAVTGQFLPDGRILVERDAGGNERTQLYVGDEPLVLDLRFKHDTPHAAGRTLAYSTNRRNGVDFDVVARDLESGEERTFAFEGYVAVAAISPDGPMTAVSLPGSMSSETPRSASTAVSPAPKRRWRSRALTTGVAAAFTVSTIPRDRPRAPYG